MRLVVTLAVTFAGIAGLHAEPSAAVEAIALDASAAPPLESCDAHVTPKPDEPDTVCKTLATRAIAGRRVRVLGTYDSMQDLAFIDLATDGGEAYFEFTGMRYTPLMGERGEVIQTNRDWSRPPAIDAGTLADGTPAALVRIPWTSREYDKSSGRWLGPSVAHAQLAVCAVGKAACSSKIEVDCPAKGCTAKLDRGVLVLVTSHGTQRRPVNP